jgi:hypothetical protein
MKYLAYNKLIISMIIGIMLLSLASATTCDGSNLGIFKQGEVINLRQTCDSCTYVTLSSITYPDSTTSTIITNMTKTGIDYNYTFNDTDNPGSYYYSVFGDKDGLMASENFCFEVTPTGNSFDVSIAILGIFILTLLIGLLVFSTKGVFRASEGGWQIFYICLSYLLLFSVFFLLWLFSKNYMFDIPILESIFWIIWLILSIIFFPFIIIVAAYILKKQAEGILEEDYAKQGYTREEAREMSKKQKRR